jgi:hypothetical protein
VQSPPLKKPNASISDLYGAIERVHECVHQYQKENRESFGEIHGRVTEVAERISYVEGMQAGTNRALGVPVPTDPARPDDPPVKHRTPFGLLSQSKVAILAAVSSVGAVGIYQVAVKVWPNVWGLLIAIHHAIMGLSQ